jgi:hypothetical protein
MSRWETTSTLEAGVSPASPWRKAYADAAAWPKWNTEIKRAQLDGPLAQGAAGAPLAPDHGTGGGTDAQRATVELAQSA